MQKRGGSLIQIIFVTIMRFLKKSIGQNLQKYLKRKKEGGVGGSKNFWYITRIQPFWLGTMSL